MNGLIVLAALTALAVILTPAGSASPPSSGIKQYTACLTQGTTPSTTACNPAALPSGSSVALTLTITNSPTSSQSLGSVNLDGPVDTSGNLLLPYVAGSPHYVAGSGSFGTNTAAELQLRNLNLAPGASVSVSFSVTTPCTGSSLAWTIAAKQSNTFNGTGNDFQQPVPPITTGVASGGCKLVWVTQPTSTKANTLITGTPFTPSGPNVQVAAVAADCVSSCSPIATVDSGTVTLIAQQTADDGTVTTPTSFTGVQATFAGGVATFGALKGAAGTGYQLQGTSDGFTPTPWSSPFVLGDGTACTTAGCPGFTSTFSDRSTVTSSASGAIFTYLAVNTGTIPASVLASGGGCANFISLNGSNGFTVAETDSRTSNTGGTLLFTYAIPTKLIQQAPNNGNPFVPICAGLQRVDSTGAQIKCTVDSAGGWLGDSLDSSGAMTGVLKQAVCDPVTGMWWGILGNYTEKIDPTANPTVTSWQGGSAVRSYNVSIPSPWDARSGW